MVAETSGGTWDEAKFQRYGLWSGVLFVVLNLVSTFVAGAPPSRDASADKIAEYFVDSESGIKAGAILFGFALIVGLWWLGSLWRVIGRLEPSGPRLAFIAVVAFLVASAMVGVAQAAFVAPALRVETLAGASEFSWSLGYAAYGFVLAATAVHMLALGALVLWQRFLPVWMGWLALLSALAGAVAIGSAGSEAGVFVILQMIGFLSWMLWVLVASVLLARQSN